MRSRLVRRCASAALIVIVGEATVILKAEEPITPIGMLLVTPSAFHRKLLKVEGIAKEVRPYSKYDVTSVCGASFKLTDETGTIEVSFRQLCQVGKEHATFVNEGSRVIVEGTMEAPSSVVRNPDGKDNEFAIYARSVVPASIAK
jgi:cytochrome c-type biogenesis protein CcmE